MNRRDEIKTRMESIDAECDIIDADIETFNERIRELKSRLHVLNDEEDLLQQELNEINRQESIRETGLSVGQTILLIGNQYTRELVRATITDIKPGHNFPVVWVRKDGDDNDVAIDAGLAAQAALRFIKEDSSPTSLAQK